MRALLLAAVLAPSPAFAAGTEPVDWRALELPLEQAEIDGLRRLGLRLEGDGRVLDLERKALDAAGLEQARRELRAGERRMRLERLRSLLAAQPQDEPLSPAARREALGLADGELLARVTRNDRSVAALSRLASLDLSAASRVFDGSEGRGAVPVEAAGARPAPRPRFPYQTTAEQRAGESLRAAAAAELSRLERGRLILSRLAGADGRPDLPPILVEAIGTAARYDGARRALVLDRDVVVAELLRGSPPADFAARRREYARPDGLARALAADPAAARRVLERQDVLVAHELVHAWQDRRDGLFRQMARGGVPRAVILEYEEEAFVEKNLYLHEKLKARPGVAVEPQEMTDYLSMMSRYEQWRAELFDTYRGFDPLSATIPKMRELQRQRLRDRRNAPAETPQAQAGKARDLLRLARGDRALSRVEEAHGARIEALRSGPIAAQTRELGLVLGRHYLRLSLSAPNAVERAVLLDKARRQAELSGDAALIEEVRSLMGPRR